MELHILNEFLEHILKTDSSAEISSKLAIIIQEQPEWSRLFYLEHSSPHRIVLWRRKDWLREQAHREQLKKDADAYREALYQRQEAFDKVRGAVIELFGMAEDERDSAVVLRLAERILIKKGNKNIQTVLDIDISQVPELPNQHTVMNEKGKVKYKL